MPAIELQRLNTEIAQILSQFDQVDRLHGSLVALMERYADWSYKPGQTFFRNVQLPSYYTPLIVAQRLIQAIKPKCQADPPTSLELIRKLRTGKYAELRVLAMQIYALLPVTDAPSAMQYVVEWANSEKEAFLVEELLSAGSVGLRANAPQVWLSAVELWLEDPDVSRQVTGLRAMIASAKDPGFDSLPSLYQLATQPLMTVPQGTAALLEELLGELIQRSPAETSFFLRQILLHNPPKHTTRLIRKKLSSIPSEFQPVLRSLLFNPGATGEKDPNDGSGIR